MNFRDDSKKLPPLTMFSQSSLTDIILLLLIFFLLTSSFVSNFGIRVNLPRAEAGVTTDVQHVSVAITSEGSFFVDGEQVQRAELSGAIRQSHQDKPQGSLVIRADEVSQFNDVVYVMNIGQALNMRMNIATDPLSR